MRRRGKSGLKGTTGTAAVEFALVLPMLLFLVLGTVEVGFLILSHASMNTTMSLVPALARRATNAEELANELDKVAALRLGLGLAQVSFPEIGVSCVCPADAADFANAGQDCPGECDGGAVALKLYTVIGRVDVPSLIPGGGRDDLCKTVGEDDGLCAKLTVLGQ